MMSPFLGPLLFCRLVELCFSTCRVLRCLQKKKNKDEIFSLAPDSDKIITIVLEKEMLQLKAKEKYNRKIKGAFTLRQRNLKRQLYFNG